MNHTFAILPDRIKAAIIDSIVLIGAMYLISELFTIFDHVPSIVRGIVAAVLFLGYEPFFTSRYGATIGHSFSNIKVIKDQEDSTHITFITALGRFVVKVLLGWLSLLTVTSNEKKKAIHDFIANSIVIEDTPDVS